MNVAPTVEDIAGASGHAGGTEAHVLAGANVGGDENVATVGVGLMK